MDVVYRKTELDLLVCELESSYKNLEHSVLLSLGEDWRDECGERFKENIVAAAGRVKDEQLSHSVLYGQSDIHTDHRGDDLVGDGHSRTDGTALTRVNVGHNSDL